jgi:ketosteroid isomerase-like protein
MNASRPEDLNPIFARACNSRDVATLLSLYEPAAKMVVRSGEVLVGHPAIEASLRRLVGLGGTFQSQTVFCLVQGDIALVNSDWSLNGGRSEAGTLIDLSARSAEVLCRQPDGTWKLRLDHPYAYVR